MVAQTEVPLHSSSTVQQHLSVYWSTLDFSLFSAIRQISMIPFTTRSLPPVISHRKDTMGFYVEGYFTRQEATQL